MLPEDNIYPASLPDGYEFVVKDEPEFNPAVHLQLERPDKIWMLSDLGYSEKVISRFASPVAATNAARLLSDEGVAVMADITRKLHPFIRHNTSGARVPATLRGTTHRSRFVRDLCLSPEIAEFFSEMFQTHLVPHTITHQQGHMNFQPKELRREVDTWHHDATAFDWVLMVHDPNKIKGGRFQIFDGTREEGWKLMHSGAGIPEDRIITPDFAGPGYACYMQGSAVFHRASRLEELNERASLVQSYVSTNVKVPDPNWFDWITPTEGAVADVNYMLEQSCAPAEWARHRAWVAKRRLQELIDELPLNASAQDVLHAMEHVTNDLNDLNDLLRRGPVTHEESQLNRHLMDARHIS